MGRNAYACCSATHTVFGSDVIMAEGQYQNRIIRKLEALFPGCLVLKTDPEHRQGIPDLIVLWGKYWAGLEVKTSATSFRQPNQDYYVEQLGEMSFAAYIYPECEK